MLILVMVIIINLIFIDESVSSIKPHDRMIPEGFEGDIKQYILFRFIFILNKTP